MIIEMYDQADFAIFTRSAFDSSSKVDRDPDLDLNNKGIRIGRAES